MSYDRLSRTTILFLILAFTASSIVFANSKNEDDKLNLLNSVSWTEAIKDPSSTSGMISYYSKHPTSVPFFFPRLISIFEFMDISDPKFYTLKQLSKNPQLSPRPQFQPFKETTINFKKQLAIPKRNLYLLKIEFVSLNKSYLMLKADQFINQTMMNSRHLLIVDTMYYPRTKIGLLNKNYF